MFDKKEMLPKGNGKLPMHVRRNLERAISEKRISNVVYTTTLLQGVNLPAQNVFIRNPHLYMRKRESSAESLLGSVCVGNYLYRI